MRLRWPGLTITRALTTPVGGGIRSLNVALRQILDLYVCLRPVRWYQGVPSPVKEPAAIDMVIFRENTEDVYAGKELESGTEGVAKLLAFLDETYGWDIRRDSGIGIKPISEVGSKRLVRAALDYALDQGRKSVTPVHKANIMKYTEGAFREWGYEVVRDEYSDVAVTWEDCNGEPGDRLLVKDVIADAFDHVHHVCRQDDRHAPLGAEMVQERLQRVAGHGGAFPGCAGRGPG